MQDLFANLNLHTGFLLLLALAFVLLYEAINGFHDTANAVATVIYTRAMKSGLAIIMAAVFNFLGVLFGGLSVAYAIVHMLPNDLLLNITAENVLAMIFAILLAAIVWNLITWYFGLPASSSHTLIGAITGINFTNYIITRPKILDSPYLSRIIEIFVPLVLSPVIGALIAGGIIFLLRRYWGGGEGESYMHLTPEEREKKDGKKKPPFLARISLILSAIGVSFSHGANDGQKGIGLIMLVLIGVAPAGFIVNMNASSDEIFRTYDSIKAIRNYFFQHSHFLKRVTSDKDQLIFSAEIPNRKQSLLYHCHTENALNSLDRVKEILGNIENYKSLSLEERIQIRRTILCISNITKKIAGLPEVTNKEKRLLKRLSREMLHTIEYAPIWIIVLVALALGIGTMTGWQRVAVTISKKIGKRGMTYAQGLSAQLTAALSIGLASYTGIPVSTTHVLSSSVAGTMIFDGVGLQRKTITNILLAWVCTLPASIFLSSSLYWIALQLI